MRAIALLLALSALAAGCVRPGETLTPNAAALDGYALPGASVSRNADGLLLAFSGAIEGAHEIEIPIPAGVTFVEATLKGAGLGFRLADAESSRSSCNAQVTESFLVRSPDTITCRGIALGAPGRAWKALLGGTGKFTLDVQLSAAPLDGSAAMIRLDRLSQPTMSALETELTTVSASADGAALWVEVTRPDTEEKVPTILVSSPYNTPARAAGVRPSDSLILDMVPRGYAVVVADVRGYGKSGGCVEVWGPNEQQDQYDLVEWVASQPWSDGKVGFYGQSYVGTTPTEAAVLAPPHLTTIAIVAPVINAWDDWHFGGVPNGESLGSPQAYQSYDALSVAPGDDAFQESVLHLANNLCDPTLALRANDPRGVYDAFYEERNFSARAKDVKASVLYWQGFWDTNVKGTMITRWFNELDVPKRGHFGSWVHQHAVRADAELFLHAWFDYWLKGVDTGVMDTPTMEVRTQNGLWRAGEAWPTPGTAEALFHLADGDALAPEPGEGSAQYAAAPVHAGLAGAAGMAESLRFASEPLAEPLYLTGHAALRFTATLEGATGTYFAAKLFDVDADGNARMVTFGMLNAAMRNGYEAHEPVTPGEAVAYSLPFLPADYVIEAGHSLALELRSSDKDDWSAYGGDGGGLTHPGLVTVDFAGSALALPTLPMSALSPAPRSAS